jgi:hypothetical protein
MLKFAEQDPYTKIEAIKKAVTQVSERTPLLPLPDSHSLDPSLENFGKHCCGYRWFPILKACVDSLGFCPHDNRHQPGQAQGKNPSSSLHSLWWSRPDCMSHTPWSEPELRDTMSDPKWSLERQGREVLTDPRRACALGCH